MRNLISQGREIVERVGSAQSKRADADVLPSLYERHPKAGTAPRRPLGLHTVPVEQIVGTLRSPSQNSADFRPLRKLRGANWDARWQRILLAMERMKPLPPVELVQVGDEYYVNDGHNRVAAARRNGVVEVDADVTELVLPGVQRTTQTRQRQTGLVGSAEIRAIGAGRHSATVAALTPSDRMDRRQLAAATSKPAEVDDAESEA